MKKVLQKFIADSGYCSRRKAEDLIKNKRVLLNKKVAVLGEKADEKDEILIGNKEISQTKDKVYIILNKPAGYTCTNRRFKNEKNIFDLVISGERLFSAGRLDKDSEGLVLLTNDGDLVQKITHPKFEHEKEYIVKIVDTRFPLSEELINKLVINFKRGVDIGENDGIARAKKIEYLGNKKFKIILTEGKKRQIKRMFRAVGFEVDNLRRTRIGNIELGNLPVGKYKQIEKKLIK